MCVMPRAYYNRGSAHDERRQFRRAIADYGMAIQIQPNYVEAYFNRGVALEKTGDKIRALADYRKAAELRPGDATVAGAFKRLGVAP